MPSTLEEQFQTDQDELKPIVEEVLLLVKNNNLCYRQYKRMIDMLIHQGADRFTINS
jgi:hypothetical protein